jgi:hypothetical protein
VCERREARQQFRRLARGDGRGTSTSGGQGIGFRVRGEQRGRGIGNHNIAGGRRFASIDGLNSCGALGRRADLQIRDGALGQAERRGGPSASLDGTVGDFKNARLAPLADFVKLIVAADHEHSAAAE